MPRAPYPTQPDPQKTPHDRDGDDRGQEDGLDPEPDGEPQRVGRRRTGVEDDDTEEIDLDDDDVIEMTEPDAKQGEGPDA